MLRFGIRGHDVPVTGNFEDWVKAIADQGFCCTQLALKKAVKDFNVSTEAMTPGMALYMKRVFAENKVDVAVLGCYLNVTTPDEAEWAETKKIYEAHFRFASLLGAGMVGTETGAMNKEYRPGPENRTEAALDKLIERLRELTDIAGKYGVILGIEPVIRHNMYDLKRTRKVLDGVNSPNLRVILDLVNLLDINNYKDQKAIIKEAFTLLKGDIDCLHIKDFKVKDGELTTAGVPLLDGELELEELFRYAKAEKPCIHVLLEDSTPDNCLISEERAKRLYSSL